MKALSRQQIKETLQNADNTTVKYDGTSKPLVHMVEVQVGTRVMIQYIWASRYKLGVLLSPKYARTITKTLKKLQQWNKTTVNLTVFFSGQVKQR